MKDKILEILKQNQTTMAVGMTLFNGVHINYFENIASEIESLIKEELIKFCEYTGCGISASQDINEYLKQRNNK